MTDKRFTKDNTGCVLDNTRIVKAINVEQVVEYLNVLYEENQDLATKKEDAEYELLHLKEKYEELLDENEQLKQQKEFCEKEALGFIREQRKFIDDLNKENEQLKKDIEYYKIERVALFEYLDKKDDLKLELKVEK